MQLDLDETLIGQNRSADVGLVGNLGANLDALLTAVSDRGGVDFSEHSAAFREIEVEAERTLAAQLDSDEVPIDPMRLCRGIADFISTDDEMIVIGDGGDIVAQASKVIKVPEHGTWMDPGPLGHARRRHAVRPRRPTVAPGQTRAHRLRRRLRSG